MINGARLFLLLGVVVSFGLAPQRSSRAAGAPAAIPGPNIPRLAQFAIVIGNNRSENSDVPDLRYADDDAIATHTLLTEAGVESLLLVRPDTESHRMHPALAPAGAPRADDLDRALSLLSAHMRAQTARGDTVELLFFYSGHGDVEHGEGYVLLEDRRFTRTMLYELLAHSPAARNHVFIDACKSFFLAFDKGPGGQREPYGRSFVEDAVPAHLRNTGFVLSTSSGRDSHEWERYQAGILSHELRSALRGAADTDRDGRVTYAELGAFLVVANQAITNAKYRPDFTVRPPQQDLQQEVLRWNPAGTATALRIEGATIGHVYVETASGERLLDAHPAPEQRLLLHIPRARPLFVRQSDETAEQVVADESPPPITSLGATRPEIASRGALHLAFQQLFAAPFGGGDVRGFERRFEDVIAAQPPPDPASHLARRRWLRVASGSVAIAGAVGGAVLGALALQRYEAGAGASQRDLPHLNASVEHLDIASIACFAVAGAAGSDLGLEPPGHGTHADRRTSRRRGLVDRIARTLLRSGNDAKDADDKTHFVARRGGTADLRRRRLYSQLGNGPVSLCRWLVLLPH